MPDIDKIIKAIKCRNGIDDTDSCTGCHYFVEEDNKLHHVYCNYHQLLNDVIDALALLKEQEAVEPYSMNAERTYGICPKCGKIVFRYGNVEENHYCGVCGQAVKWE